MAKLRISIVQYLNTSPLVWGFTNGTLRGKYELFFTVPAQCAEALRNGAADIAIIPAIEYQRIDGIAVLPDIAIASKHQVRSLLVISKKPIQEAQSIALDRSSRSTQALTRILCAEKWKIAPQFLEAEPDLPAMLQRADAALLIGDPALRLSILAQSGMQRGPGRETICDAKMMRVSGASSLYIYDIVEEWRGLTGLPAVLAIWAARKKAVTSELLRDFAASRSEGLASLAEISECASRELDLSAAALHAYLKHNIDFSLDEENRSGLEAYYNHAAKLGLIPGNKPIEWAAGVAAKEPAKIC